MIRRIVTCLLVVALAAAVVYGIFWVYELWRDTVYAQGEIAGRAEIQKQWDAWKVESWQAFEAGAQQIRKEEREAAAKAAQGEKDARDRAEARAAQQAAAARRAASAAGGLSGQLAALDAAARAANVPDAAACPGLFAQQREHAIRARALFGACVTEYRSLAADADSALAGLELRLDTALNWMRATDAPGATELPTTSP